MSGLRSFLYKAASFLGDIEALKKGPEAFGKRIIRKEMYKKTNGITNKLTRKIFK